MFHFIYHIILEVRFILKFLKNEIQRYLKNKDYYLSIFDIDFVDIIYIFKVFLKLINFTFIKFLKKTNVGNFEKCDILIEYLNGDNSNKKDFPYKKGAF